MADAKMTTLYHPTFADTTAEVPTADVDDWTEQGWRKTKPKADSE